MDLGNSFYNLPGVIAFQEHLNVRFAINDTDSTKSLMGTDFIYAGKAIVDHGSTYAVLDTWFWNLFGYTATWSENHDRVDIKRVTRAANVPSGWYSITDEIGGALHFDDGLNLDIKLPISDKVYWNATDFSTLSQMSVGMAYYKPDDRDSMQVVFLQPVKIQYQLFRTGANGDVLVYAYDFPPFVGSIPPNREYFVNSEMPHWNKADMKPGKYKLVFNVSESFVYCLESDPTVLVAPTSGRIKGMREMEFEVVAG
jgi:hypothetical protein